MLSPDCCLHGLCSVLLAWPLLIVACMLLVVLFFVVAPCVVGLVFVDCRWCYIACCALLVAGVVGSSGHWRVHIVGCLLVVAGVVDYCGY